MGMEAFEVEHWTWSYYFALFPKTELKTFVVAMKIKRV